ncbi:MAG: hypothetical protein ACRKFN_11545 [Desulfitobacterium sp.]
MFIVLYKKVVKRYIVLSLMLIFLGRLLVSAPVAVASPMEIPVEMTKAELIAEGFSEEELQQMGFISGIGKIIVYNAKQKQIWDSRVMKAQERIKIAKIKGKKPSPRDVALVELDEQRKNPPKQRFVEKWFGQTAQMYWDHWHRENRQNIEFLGNGITLAGLFWLIKTLGPFALAL